MEGPSLPLAGLARRWEEEALRRGARWFGIACACLPLLDLLDGHSVVDAVLAGAATGSWPGVPLRVWGALVWVVAVAVAAARLLAWLAPRPRAWLFAACVAMHAAYAIASGARLAALAAMASFAYSFVVLQGARETWPEGHPGAPRG
ncbi:MAG: hypothetical protein JNK56_04505 [Myxococcales bacterium]|nr:hypothetical protein [Myxococcales bacterium]